MKIRFISLILSVLIMIPVFPQSIVHPWAGKKVAYLGDSITDPKNRAASKKYWAWLEEWLDITPLVYAVSGRQWSDIPRQCDKLRAEHGDDFDAIIILMGTNDYNNAVPIGRWYDEEVVNVEYGHRYDKRPETRTRRHPSMDAATFCGRINIALDSLKRTFPDKQIVLLTPLHRAGFYHSPTNWQTSEDYTNRLGLYLDTYVDAVKEAGKVWAVPVIDLGQLSGLYPLLDTHTQYFNDADTDRLHPNDNGHHRMAATLLYQLGTIPCIFTYPPTR